VSTLAAVPKCHQGDRVEPSRNPRDLSSSAARRQADDVDRLVVVRSPARPERRPGR